MYKNIQKVLDWGVKLASIAITAPATWIVATELFADVESSFLLFLMRFAAVFLIEGVLLSNWLLLEFDKGAAPEVKARYAITALVMYAALAVIGFRHEGPTGIVFRVALLAALIGSGWDTYVYTWQRATANIDRSAQNARKVRRHARKLAIKEAITRREAEHSAEIALIRAEGQAALHRNDLYGKRLMARVNVEDKSEMLTIEEVGRQLEIGPGVPIDSRHENGHENGHALPADLSGKKKPSFQPLASLPELTEESSSSSFMTRSMQDLEPLPPLKGSLSPAEHARPAALSGASARGLTPLPRDSRKAPASAPSRNVERSTSRPETHARRPSSPVVKRRVLAALAADNERHTHTEIAEIIGHNRSEVTRAVNELLEEGKIEKKGSRVIIVPGVDAPPAD